jgi:hypothetical protein
MKIEIKFDLRYATKSIEKLKTILVNFAIKEDLKIEC